MRRIPRTQEAGLVPPRNTTVSDIVLPDGWEFCFPTWVMVNAARFSEVGLPDAYNGLTDPNLGMVFAFFTDEHLAQQYIDDTGWAQLRPHPVEDLVSFRELVEVAGDGGITKLAVDPTQRGNLKSRVYELNEFLDNLREPAEED